MTYAEISYNGGFPHWCYKKVKKGVITYVDVEGYFYPHTDDGDERLKVLREVTKEEYEALPIWETTRYENYANGMDVDLSDGRTVSQAWIAPDGRLVIVEYAKHEKAAKELWDSSAWELLGKGFVQIGMGDYFTFTKPTEIQRDIMVKLKAKYKYNRHYPQSLPLTHYYELDEKDIY